MDIKNAQLAVDEWIKQHGVRYFNELTNMAQLTEEVGEVARIIARRYGEQSEKESDKNKEMMSQWEKAEANRIKNTENRSATSSLSNLSVKRKSSKVVRRKGTSIGFSYDDLIYEYESYKIIEG